MKSEQLAHYRLVLEEQLAHLTEATGAHESVIDESHTTKDFVGADRAAELETHVRNRLSSPKPAKVQLYPLFGRHQFLNGCSLRSSSVW